MPTLIPRSDGADLDIGRGRNFDSVNWETPIPLIASDTLNTCLSLP